MIRRALRLGFGSQLLHLLLSSLDFLWSSSFEIFISISHLIGKILLSIASSATSVDCIRIHLTELRLCNILSIVFQVVVMGHYRRVVNASSTSSYAHSGTWRFLWSGEHVVSSKSSASDGLVESWLGIRSLVATCTRHHGLIKVLMVDILATRTDFMSHRFNVTTCYTDSISPQGNVIILPNSIRLVQISL